MFLWKFYWDCGRMGSVEGLFIASQDEIDKSIGKQVYFGEILGKHSEIYGTLDLEDLEKVDLEESAVLKLKELLGDTLSGYNPLEYISDEEYEE